MLVCQPYPAKTLMYKKTLLTDLSPSVLPFYFAYTSHNSLKGLSLHLALREIPELPFSSGSSVHNCDYFIFHIT